MPPTLALMSHGHPQSYKAHSIKKPSRSCLCWRYLNVAKYLLGDGEACYLVSFYAMFSMIFNFIEVTDEDDDDAVIWHRCILLFWRDLVLR